MSVATEELYCGACGDPADTLDTDGHGRCCRNLPNPWHRGSDGLYTRTSESEYFEEEDEEEEGRAQPPHCHACGSTEWLISATQRVRAGEEDDGDTIYYDYHDFDNVTARCAHCEAVPHDYDLEPT